MRCGLAGKSQGETCADEAIFDQKGDSIVFPVGRMAAGQLLSPS